MRFMRIMINSSCESPSPYFEYSSSLQLKEMCLLKIFRPKVKLMGVNLLHPFRKIRSNLDRFYIIALGLLR